MLPSTVIAQLKQQRQVISLNDTYRNKPPKFSTKKFPEKKSFNIS
jgi:hypothetical protein